MSATKKIGRPTNTEGARETLVVINFKADVETMEAIAVLEAESKGLINGRSTVIRRALIETAARVKNKRSQKG